MNLASRGGTGSRSRMSRSSGSNFAPAIPTPKSRELDDGVTRAVDEFVDSGAASLVMIDHTQFANHNGGQLQFGPDGHLYISVGDGDSGVLHPPGTFAQTRDDLLGDIVISVPYAARIRFSDPKWPSSARLRSGPPP